MSQLDALLAQHGEAEGCPTSREFRRQLVIELRRVLRVQRGVPLRRRGRR